MKDETVGDESFTVLFQYGLAGVVILAQALAIKALYKDNQNLQDEIKEVQDQRRTDLAETVDKITAPLANMSDSLGLINEKIEMSKRGRR